jgi:hypothetical protein
MSRNLGTRRPSWLAKLIYASAAVLLIVLVAVAIRLGSDEPQPIRGASGTLTPDDAVTPPAPVTPPR